MTTSAPLPSLSTAQQTAVAKLAYALESGGAVAVLCGPAGVGKSLVLVALARCPTMRGRSIATFSPATLRATVAGGTVPDVVLVDDAHLVDDAELTRLVDACRAAAPAVAIVLAGQGRLLTLLSRDSRLEKLVRVRVTVPPFSLAETRLLVAAVAGVGVLPGDDDSVVTTIHEIAGGIPARVVQLADLAAVVAAGNGGQPLTSQDVEAIHRRLAITAA